MDILPTTDLIDKEKYSKEIINKYKDKKVIALTFDDGPSKYTEKLLDILKENDVKVTFFVLGYKAESKTDVIKRASDEGHEIGIHGYSHALFTKLSEDEINDEIESCRDILENIVSNKISLIRIPYGITNDKINNIILKHDMTSILWNIDSKDWKLRNKAKISKKVIKNAKDKKIILMHDTYAFSVNAVETIIKELKEDGFTFITMSELLILKNADN